jgi:hypothetical protein
LAVCIACLLSHRVDPDVVADIAVVRKWRKRSRKVQG